MRTGYVAVFAVLAALLLPSAARAQYFDCESYVYYDGNALSGYSRTVDYNMEYVVGVESTLYDPYHQQMDQNSDFPLYFTWAEADVREYPYQWDAWFSVEGQHWYWGDDWCQYGCWEELPGSYYPTYVESTPPPPPAQITVCPVPSPPWGSGSNSAVIGGSGFSGNTPQVSWSGNGGVNFLQSSSATVTSDTQINFSVSLAPVTSDGSITLGVGTAACVIPVLAALPPPTSVTLSPELLYLSTGDTNRQVTTSVSPSTISFTAVYTYNREASQPQGGQCNVNLSIPNGSGTGTVNSTVTASQEGCSNVLNVYATAAGTMSNYVTVVVPPQKLIQMLNGEAGGQTAAGDMSQLSIGVAARNRFGDSNFGGYSTYNDVISHGFAPSGINYGHDPELPNAAKVYRNDASTVNIIEDAKCFWSPTATQWSLVQSALQSQTTVFPAGTGVPDCWSSLPRQIIYKSSVALTTRPSPYAGAPAFLFLRERNANDPAVRQIN